MTSVLPWYNIRCCQCCISLLRIIRIFLRLDLQLCLRPYLKSSTVVRSHLQLLLRPRPFSTPPAGGVLVHCAQGVSRSAAVLTAYLMSHARFSFDTALSHVQQARPVADPNQGFRLQLQEFERLGCCCESWAGWDRQRFERCFKSSSVSGRRAVHGMADLIRRFHVHDVCDDDLVFCDSTVIL